MPTMQQPSKLGDVARKIRAAREQRRLSLRELSLLCNVPFYTIHKAEKGEEISASSLIAICKKLKIQL